jgi:RNA polymerase sigma factor (sigma-70 family)
VIDRAPLSRPFDFTPEEQGHYDALVPGVAQEAVAALIREYGCAEQEDDLLQEAHCGVARGVRSFDETKGLPLKSWAFFSALHAARAILRKDKRHRRLIQRMWDGMLVVCQAEGGPARFDLLHDTDEMNRAALTRFRGLLAAAPCVGVALLEETVGGEDDLVHRETSWRCAQALKEVLGELSDRQLGLLRRRFANNLSVKEAAKAIGEKGYRAELVEFHRIVNLVAARMQGRGFDAPAPLPHEVKDMLLTEMPTSPAGKP